MFILLGVLAGCLFHYGFGAKEGFQTINLQFVARALNDSGILWYSSPYLLLAFGTAFKQRLALWTILLSMIVAMVIDGYMLSGTSHEQRGWYFALSPIALLVTAGIGFLLAWFVNRITSPDRAEDGMAQRPAHTEQSRDV